MANRMKEDERNEKIIRGLLKLPANRRCINCNSLGPQYVCTNFWTFICTNCSGIHREFTHRVKSVSMAKFTSQEVNALQEGGNERAKEVYFKEWDAQRHSFPDSSNVDRLRDFIKHVYVDRRYSEERSIDRPSRVKKEDSYDNRKPDAYGGGSRSPSYEETYDRRYGERPGSGGRNDDRNFRSSYEERRSPGYDQGDYRRSPGRFDAVDERRRFPDGVPRPEGRPVINQKEPEISSPPMIRPVREIIGEDAPPLRVGEPPRANGTRVADAPAQALRTTSSSSLASTDSNPVELKRVNSGSLIDFDANPEPSVVAAPPPLQPAPQPTNFPVNGGNWASFDSVPPQKAQQPAANLNTVESALAELSVNPAGSSPSTFSNPHVDLFSLTSDVGQGPVNQQNQRSLFQATPNQSSVMHSSVPPFNPPPVVAPTSQPWASSFAPNAQLPLTTPSGQPSQTAVKSSTEPNVGGFPMALAEAKPTGRKELPANLFTASYPTASQHPGWQTGPHLPIGYGLQYPTAMAIPSFPQPSRSINPFDSSNDQTLVHATSFPSMLPPQGALPNVLAPSPLMRTVSLGSSPSPRWVASQQPSYPSAVPPSGFLVQQAPSNISHLAPTSLLQPGHQQLGGFSGEGAAFGAFGADQHLAARYSQPGTPNFPSVGRNPFG